MRKRYPGLTLVSVVSTIIVCNAYLICLPCFERSHSYFPALLEMYLTSWVQDLIPVCYQLKLVYLQFVMNFSKWLQEAKEIKLEPEKGGGYTSKKFKDRIMPLYVRIITGRPFSIDTLPQTYRDLQRPSRILFRFFLPYTFVALAGPTIVYLCSKNNFVDKPWQTREEATNHDIYIYDYINFTSLMAMNLWNGAVNNL